MDQFTRRDLRQLVAARHPACVSMFLPMHRKARDVNENRIRCKNALTAAEGQLLDMGVPATTARAILLPGRELEENNDFWLRQSDGLAMFAAPDSFHVFRVPLNFTQQVVAGRQFHIRPMLPLLQGDGTFYVLAVSQNRVRLLRGTRHRVTELDPATLPHNLREALNVGEWKADLTHKDFPTFTAGRDGNTVAQAFPGHGDSLDVTKNAELEQYFMRIDDGLQEFFREENDPLVFAGVDYLFPMFKEACHYRRLIAEPVTGNPDGLSADELHRKAWALVEPGFRAGEATALERYGDGTPRGLASDDVGQILEAATTGRVETLFLNPQREIWGRVDERTGHVQHLCETPQPGAVDLLDHAAAQTLRTGGTVYAIAADRMPNHSAMAAIYRYRLEETGGQPRATEKTAT